MIHVIYIVIWQLIIMDIVVHYDIEMNRNDVYIYIYMIIYTYICMIMAAINRFRNISGQNLLSNCDSRSCVEPFWHDFVEWFNFFQNGETTMMDGMRKDHMKCHKYMNMWQRRWDGEMDIVRKKLGSSKQWRFPRHVWISSKHDDQTWWPRIWAATSPGFQQ